MPSWQPRRGGERADVLLLGGLAFDLAGAALSPGEREWLSRYELPPSRWPDVRVTTVATARQLETGGEPLQPPPMLWGDGRLEVLLPRARAVIDVSGGAVTVERPAGETGALETVLRVALACLLPSRAGVLLHAATIGTPGGALLFHGPSGAGKSTVAALAPAGFMGEEHVAVLGPAPYMAAPLVPSWQAVAALPPAPVRALLQLDKGPEFRLTALPGPEAVRSLLPSLLVPPAAAPVWERAIAVLADVVAGVPAYRMSWHIDEPPWQDLAAAGLF